MKIEYFLEKSDLRLRNQTLNMGCIIGHFLLLTIVFISLCSFHVLGIGLSIFLSCLLNLSLYFLVMSSELGSFFSLITSIELSFLFSFSIIFFLLCLLNETFYFPFMFSESGFFLVMSSESVSLFSFHVF